LAIQAASGGGSSGSILAAASHGSISAGSASAVTCTAFVSGSHAGNLIRQFQGTLGRDFGVPGEWELESTRPGGATHRYWASLVIRAGWRIAANIWAAK
jgi:hypothetical protein